VASRLARAAATLLGGELAEATTLPGGDLSEIVRIRLTDDRIAVAKGGPAPRVEAAMLAAIGASGAPAPTVLAVSDDVLVLEALAESETVGNAWGDLGAVLATLHAVTGAGYGWPDDYAFGEVPIVNARTEDWPTFWSQYRLLAHVPDVSPILARRIESLAASLSGRLPARPRAALLHGDRWGGNVLVADGRISGLIDPACYHGHVEVDIAMLSLFGHPSPAFYACYGELEPGHAERLAIYQLWPALVHRRLFGRSYEPLVARLLAAAGA
jgi:fructosamine-3-kinase